MNTQIPYFGRTIDARIRLIAYDQFNIMLLSSDCEKILQKIPTKDYKNDDVLLMHIYSYIRENHKNNSKD